MDEVVLDVPVGPLVALRARPAGPPRGRVLVVPGYLGGHEGHRVLVTALAARGAEAVVVAQRGQAGSVHPEPPGCDVETASGSYALPDLARDVADVADALVTLDPAWAAAATGPLLVGHSFGGVVAAEAVLADPARWSGLVLLCSGPHGWPGRKADEIAVLEGEGTTRALLAALDAAGAAARREAGDQAAAPPDATEQAHREAVLATSPGQLLAAARVLRDHEDRSPLLRAAGLPVVVAHGEADDAWPQADQRAMAAAVGARYVVLPGAHSPGVEAPAETADLLVEVLDAHR